MRKPLRSFIAATLAVVLFNATSIFACGPFTMEAVFVHTVHPTFPVERFAAGRVGVVQPSYARSYLYVAYRYLSGSRFTSAEQRALTEFWQARLNIIEGSNEEDWTKGWLEARKKVGSQNIETISVYRSREKPNEYETYVNCQKDSFETATATLNQRIAKYGADSAAIKTWLSAQDQVFSNCGGGSSIPEQIPTEADVLLRADRAYQVAAANFYAGNFDEAQKSFTAIASDSGSPWQQSAVYLIARALIRKASLGPEDTKQQSLSAAENQLRKILADNKLSSLHAAATRLLNLVALRLHTEQRLNELAHILTATTENPNLKQDLWDYTFLLDTYLGDDEEAEDAKPARELPKKEDLTDWIATFQNSTATVKAHALERWQTSHGNAWFIAALTALEGKDAKAAELIAEARKVPSGSPAFASARFHAIRLLMESGQNAEARTLLDQTLKTERAHLDESSVNLLIGRRMLLANSLTEFLTDATRIPAALTWNDDGREVPADAENSSAEINANKGKPFFDVDAAHALNQQMPLSVLKEAVKSEVLPIGPRRDLAQATWLRAALLGDTTTADELVPVLSKLVPQMSESLNKYLAASPAEKKFTAIYTWLKFPGVEPVVDAGIGRELPLHQQDSYRDNWWCSSYLEPATDEEEKEVVDFTATTTGAPPKFLTSAEIGQGAKEWATLDALGTAPNYITRQVIEWAGSHPNDPRVPEALHLAVKTTRYGCTDKESSRWSKTAFDLLHRKYPTSPWTKKTPYWFKD